MRRRRRNPVSPGMAAVLILGAAGAAAGAVVYATSAKAAPKPVAAGSGKGLYLGPGLLKGAGNPAGVTGVVLGATNSTPETVGWRPGTDVQITVPSANDKTSTIVSVNGVAYAGQSYGIAASQVKTGATYTVVWKGAMCPTGTCTFSFVVQPLTS